MTVLHASAVLALVHDEPGAEFVADDLRLLAVARGIGLPVAAPGLR